ncbi:MAG: MotA/TolQ/ExbB proton channel family protein [Campylobacterales bacterium]|nr:MotA/TolQ/ExbB proton channel family protein [Campylobacterales bacterium]
MRVLLTLSFLALFSFANEIKTIDNYSDLLKKIQQISKQELSLEKEREAKFLEDKKRSKKLLKEAKQDLKKEKAETSKLQKLIDENEKEISKLETKLTKRSGNLGEMFGVVRESAGELNAVIEDSIVSLEYKDRDKFLKQLSKSKELPSIKDLNKLWYILEQEMIESGKTTKFKSDVIGSDGVRTSKEVVRVGSFALLSDGKYLKYINKNAVIYPRQPDGSHLSYAEDFIETKEYQTVMIDPTRGSILGLLTEKPTILERVNQGGIVGYAILFLGLIGVIAGLYRGIFLFTVSKKVKIQLKDLSTIKLDNPLGRVVTAITSKEELDKSIENIAEEAVLKELPKLEYGLDFIKLLSAVAPLMGLLGTVTGMIITFNAITVFGTGDPKLMAGGISTALITTVLGLVVAIPLLFIHSVLSYKSKEVADIIEHQAIGLVAKEENK